MKPETRNLRIDSQNQNVSELHDEQTSYRQIVKATSIFGGVQVIQILISIIRSKFIAVLLGPAGMGIAGLLISNTSFIGALTNFGLGTSAVRNVAEASGSGNSHRIATVITVLRRLVWITGTLGSVITAVLSPWLSQLTFGTKEYTLAFVWISVTLLFNQLSSGQMVLLQGMRKIQYLARASVSGSILGLIITVPLYYKFGIKGIVPGIILSSLSSLALSWYFARKVPLKKVKVSPLRTWAEGKNMMTMGFMISLSGLITLGVSYIMRIFISRTGGVADVGFYNAGFAIINTYVGLIFTAMGTDYYPRLSAVSHNNELCKKTINQQAEIAILILAPIITLFMVFIKWVIVLLYSHRFTGIDDMILWAALGMFFKASSWSVAFIFLAKGASRLFFWNELLANIYMLGLNLIAFKHFGLTGLGFSFLVVYVIYLIQVYLMSKKRYSFTFHAEFIKIFLIQLLLGIGSFIIMKTLKVPLTYIAGSMLILASSLYSYIELNKRININKWYSSFFIENHY